MTIKVTELPKPSNMCSNSEYTKMSEACKNLRTELANWIKIAPASVMASNSREFAEIMHKKLTEISYGGACFRLLDFVPDMKVVDATGHTIIVTNSNIEHSYATNRFADEINKDQSRYCYFQELERRGTMLILSMGRRLQDSMRLVFQRPWYQEILQ